MNILFLGYSEKETTLISFLKSRGHQLKWKSSRVNTFSDYDLVISFGYRFIIKQRELNTLKRPIINLHASLLPYNRGAHPNFWAHYENTPSGVSIHEIDVGVDTGPLISQKRVVFPNEAISLQESYHLLITAIEDLFIENIDVIEQYAYHPVQLTEIGTSHKKTDLPPWVNWSMTLHEIKQRNKKSI
jgi:methionyl-tRNA formyltransferase